MNYLFKKHIAFIMITLGMGLHGQHAHRNSFEKGKQYIVGVCAHTLIKQVTESSVNYILSCFSNELITQEDKKTVISSISTGTQAALGAYYAEFYKKTETQKNSDLFKEAYSAGAQFSPFVSFLYMLKEELLNKEQMKTNDQYQLDFNRFIDTYHGTRTDDDNSKRAFVGYEEAPYPSMLDAMAVVVGVIFSKIAFEISKVASLKLVECGVKLGIAHSPIMKKWIEKTAEKYIQIVTVTFLSDLFIDYVKSLFGQDIGLTQEELKKLIIIGVIGRISYTTYLPNQINFFTDF